jgi:hypothetical protein
MVIGLVAGLLAGTAVGTMAQSSEDAAYDPLSSIRARGAGQRAGGPVDYDPLSSIQAPAAGSNMHAPVEFSGKIDFGTPIKPESSETIAGVTWNRGGVWGGTVEGMSDPRLDGTMTSAANMNIYPPTTADGPPVFAFNEVIRIENEHGAWQALPHVGFFSPGFSADDVMADWTIVLDGEGGYEGLSAIAYFDTQATETGGWIDVHGVILPGDHPPLPASATAE